MHTLLGYNRYLKVFSIFKIKTLRFDSRKSDFLFFNRFLADEATVLVIGACTGITTIPLAQNHYHRKIIAYEPLVSNFNALKKVVDYYRLTNISLFNTGLGNKTEQVEMVLPIVNGIKKQGLAHVKTLNTEGFNTGVSEIIEIDKLDHRKELQQITIGAIKLVAENFELQVLEGAKELILKNRPLIYCELWDNEKRKIVLDLIQSWNYDVFYNKQNQLCLYDPIAYKGKNYFFKAKP
jgi:FkbM family methyltransferase